jgi:hypothetical protein
MKRVFLGFVLLAGLVSISSGADADTNRWQSVVLWSNQTLSASLMYMPEASLANEDYMFVEFDNHTDKTLDVMQAWLGLPGTRTDRQTQKSVFMSDMTGGVIYNGKLPPGKTKAVQHGVFECGLANLGLPPKQGFHVELQAKADLRLTDGTTFSTKADGEKFSFDWRYPNVDEIESMKIHLKELVANPKYDFGYSYRLLSLIRVSEVADALSLDELLSTLGTRQNSVDGRDSIVSEIARRFSNSPRVVAYYEKEFKNADSPAWDDCLISNIWNPEFIEPFIERYEQGKDVLTLGVLAMHRTDWSGNPQYVARLSAALLKRQPILNRDVSELSNDELCAWSTAVGDLSMVADTNFLKGLEISLDDKRVIPDCIPKYSQQGRLPWTPRVCDRALGAILMIVDGDSWSAFKKAGIKGWRTKEEDYAAHDKVIADLKTRLKIKS